MIISKEQIKLFKKAKTLVLRLHDDYTTVELELDSKGEIRAKLESNDKGRLIRNINGDWVKSYLNLDQKYQTFTYFLKANDEVFFYFKPNGSQLTKKSGIEVFEIHAVIHRKIRNQNKQFVIHLGLQYQQESSPYKSLKTA